MLTNYENKIQFQCYLHYFRNVIFRSFCIKIVYVIQCNENNRFTIEINV